MTQTELETAYQRLRQKKFSSELSDDEVRTLLAYEYWKDGMDWEYVEAIAGPYWTRTLAIKALVECFEYQEV